MAESEIKDAVKQHTDGIDARPTGGFRFLSQISVDGRRDFISKKRLAGLVLNKQVTVKC
jgi:hypothetical protein